MSTDRMGWGVVLGQRKRHLYVTTDGWQSGQSVCGTSRFGQDDDMSRAVGVVKDCKRCATMAKDSRRDAP